MVFVMPKSIPVFLLLIVALFAGSCTSKKPNIIFILNEGQRWDALGVAGNTNIKTPNLDQLAKDGVRFENAFVTSTISLSSRASILTGQYPSALALDDLKKELTDEQFGSSYPVQLKKNGYKIGFVGKYGLGTPELKREKNTFDYFWGHNGFSNYEYLNGVGNTIAYTELVARQSFEFLDQTTPDTPFCLSISFKGEDLMNDKLFSSSVQGHKASNDEGLGFLSQSNTEGGLEKFPGLLTGAFSNSSNEARKLWESRFSTPEKFHKTVGAYYQMIAGVDAVVGELRTKLAAKGLSENTVIIYMSDSGCFLGEHGLAGKWYGYEPAVHVPLMVFDPSLDRSLRGKVFEQFALNIDIAPTILELADVKKTANIQGVSLLAAYKRKSDVWRKQFYYENLIQVADIPRSKGLRTEKYKYLYYQDSPNGHEELYDLEKDPNELDDLSTRSENKEILVNLRNKLKLTYETTN